MFEDNYKRGMALLGPSDTQMERLMTVLDKEEIPVKTAKSAARVVLLAAALCAVLTVTALAVSPGLRETLASALGGFAPYSQELEGITAVDQGLEVKVVSALSDGNVIRLYFTVQDLEGDRLDEYTSTNLQITPPSQTDGRWKSGTIYLSELVSYDKETKTALFTTGLVGDGLPVSDLTVDAGAQVFTPGRHEFRLDLPELGTPETLRSKTLDSGETVLIPGQTPVELESDVLSLSAYGFGGDEKLHILYQLHVPVETMYIRTFLSSRAWEAGDPAGNALSQRYNQALSQEVTFLENGVTYYDVAYDMNAEDANDVFPREVYGNIESGKEIKGTWRFEIPLENAEARVIDLRGSGTILDGVTGERLSLSSIGATVEGNPNETSSQLAYKLTVFLKDGTRLHGTVDSNHYSKDYCSAHSSFKEPLDVDQVVGVALGMWYIPIDGDTAGQGHWLDAMP